MPGDESHLRLYRLPDSLSKRFHLGVGNFCVLVRTLIRGKLDRRYAEILMLLLTTCATSADAQVPAVQDQLRATT